MPENHRYSTMPTQWTKSSLNFTEENYGVKLLFDGIDSAHSDMCLSYIIRNIFSILNGSCKLFQRII